LQAEDWLTAHDANNAIVEREPQQLSIGNCSVRPDRKYDGVDGPRVAIAHDYLTQRGGAEKVVLSMSRAFPDAPIYTLLYDPTETYPEFADRNVRVSRLNNVGFFRKNHRAALPILPLAAQSMYIDADVVVTSSSGWAHGFRTRGRKLVHCHSPARWLYLRDKYLGEKSSVSTRAALAGTSWYLRAWDRRAALTCDRYLAVSTVVQRRIADAYGISADVVPSPVPMSGHAAAEPVAEVLRWLCDSGHTDPNAALYLCVSRLLPYKNVDAVARAFAGGDRRLVIVGRGPETERIRNLKTPNVLMLSDLTNDQMVWLYQHCRALISASYEDFGLTPIEAGVWGRPAVALRFGGFLDTINEFVSGIYFDEPTPQAIADALDTFEHIAFDPDKIRDHVAQFSEESFIERLRMAVDDLSWTSRS
jgi:glycosyltransferase involved in cell wall biosynthesis